MRVFTVLGIVLTVIGVGLVFVAITPHGSGIEGEVTGMGAGIAALTLLPMGIIFTVVGVATSRVMGAGQRLLQSGIPGQATVLSVSGGNVVVNNINVLLTFRLRVSVPGRPPYETDHRQLTSMFSMAALQVGATVPVMVDPTDPRRLVIDLAGVGSAAASQARVVSDPRDAPPVPATIQPNTLSTMGAVTPNTIATADQGFDGATAAAISGQLSRMGVSVDPGLITGGQVTMDAATLDLRPGAQETVLATGRPGSASIRVIGDTGVNVRGESLVRLTLSVTPEGGTPYEVQTGSLMPDAARPRALPGTTVPVRIDPAQPTNVVIDWSALR